MPNKDGTGPAGSGQGGRGRGPCGQGRHGGGFGRGAGGRRGVFQTPAAAGGDEMQALKARVEALERRLSDNKKEAK